jgi:hypothetical protein
MTENEKEGWTTFRIVRSERMRVFVDGLEWPEGMSEEDFKKYHDEWFKKHDMQG